MFKVYRKPILIVSLFFIIIFIMSILGANLIKRNYINPNKKIYKKDLIYDNQNSLIKNSGYKIRIENRFVSEDGNEIIIGNNIKELENGYFDIKIEEKSSQILNIYFNKLLKEEIIVDKFTDREYIDKFLNEITRKYGLNLSKEDVSTLAAKTEVLFNAIRLSRDSDSTFDVAFKASMYRINFSKEDNMLKLTIGLEQ